MSVFLFIDSFNLTHTHMRIYPESHICFYGSSVTPNTLFKALSDDTRLCMLLLIMEEQELCVCELMVALDAIQPKISRHLALLKITGLLQDRRQGQWIYYRLHSDLPQWVMEVIQATGRSGLSTIDKERMRLAQMGNRPERQQNICNQIVC